jgi:hypothetical protein
MYSAKISGLEAAGGSLRGLFVNLSNIQDVTDSANPVDVPSLEQFDKDGNKVNRTNFSKGLRCLVDLLKSTNNPIGILLAAKTLGRAEEYENVETILALLLTNATITFERKLLDVNDDNPNIPGTKVDRKQYFTDIKSCKLDNAVVAAVMPIAAQQIGEVKKKAATMSIVNPFI